MSEKPGVFIRIGKTLITWTAVIASVATVIGLLIQLRPSSPQLEGLVTRKEQLTAQPQDKQLKVTYEFGDRQVQDLWRVRLQLKQVGGQTIVGRGLRQNIIGDYIPIIVSSGFEIVDIITDKNDVDADVRKFTNNEIRIFFSQWRKDEVVSLILLLERKGDGVLSSGSFSSARSIVDGTITYSIVEDTVAHVKRPLMDYLPFALTLPLRIILSFVGFVFAVGGVGAAISCFGDLRENKIKYSWQKRYKLAALEYLKSSVGEMDFKILESEGFSVSSYTEQQLLRSSSGSFWGGFSGPAPSSIRWLGGDIKSPGAEFVGALFGMLFLSIMGISILSLSWSV